MKTAGHRVQREADKAGRVRGEEVCSFELGATGFYCWHQCKGQQATSSCSQTVKWAWRDHRRASGPSGGDSRHSAPDHPLFPFPLSSTLRILPKPESVHSHISSLFGEFFPHTFLIRPASSSPHRRLGPLGTYILLASWWAPTGSGGEGGFLPLAPWESVAQK